MTKFIIIILKIFSNEQRIRITNYLMRKNYVNLGKLEWEFLKRNDYLVGLLPWYIRRNPRFKNDIETQISKDQNFRILSSLFLDSGTDPQLLIIGEMRSGTSLVLDFLKTHLININALPFEPRYFSDNSLNWNLASYQRLFIPDAINVEKSSNYSLFVSNLPKSSNRIFIIRCPYDRAKSHFNHWKERNVNSGLDFYTFLNEDVENCVSRGCYENVVSLLDKSKDIILVLEEWNTTGRAQLLKWLENLGYMVNYSSRKASDRKVNARKYSVSDVDIPEEARIRWSMSKNELEKMGVSVPWTF